MNFNKNALEYNKLLNLKQTENVRNTMCAEVLKVIASYETGLTHEMERLSTQLNRKINQNEMNNLLETYSNHPLYRPLIEDARTKMASRVYGFRKVFHKHLENYIDSVSKSDFDRFLGDKSITLEERIDENIDAFKRLKDR
jgi:oligoendopeptidase F